LSDKHAEQARKMIAERSYGYATAFRRVRHEKSMAELRTDGIAGCLRTPRGGSGRQILFKAGKGKYQVRLLTARECARLQGVPDTYVVDVPLNQALFGFGDAVCVPAIEWIAQHYLTPLASSHDSELLRR
jgi:DNA (cytosine-5)-methyltransferase 1